MHNNSPLQKLKYQITNNIQFPKTETCSCQDQEFRDYKTNMQFRSFGIRIWSLFVFWNLFFVIFSEPNKCRSQSHLCCIKASTFSEVNYPRYFIATNPLINNITNTMVKILKYFSINTFIFGPNT